MRMFKVLVLLFALTLFLTYGSYAEGPSRIAFINVAKVFENYKKTQDADAKLEKTGQKKNAERDKIVSKVNKLRDEFQLLSKDAQTKKQDEVNDLMRELQDFDRDAKVDLQRERNDMVKDIFKEIDDVIK